MTPNTASAGSDRPRHPAQGLEPRHQLLKDWSLGAIIVAATLLAYYPALHGEFVWDDEWWTSNLDPLFRDWSGLWRIWTDTTAMQQYYPLTGTSFWLDHQLWGEWTLPYHVENLLLHALSALLFWRLLRHLDVPGAWLASAIFALHPVMVESVAWITERKNVLCLPLFLGALLTYGRHNGFWNWKPGDTGSRRWIWYALSLALFVAAMLAKITAFALPVVVLLLAWWKRGELRWREDMLPTLPFFSISFGVGILVSWLETHHVGAEGIDFDIPLAQRFLIAGRALWFYPAKLLWPANLCPVYPRWQPDTGVGWQWLFPLGAGAVLAGVWLARSRLGRGPATAFLFFAITLFPVLGFLNTYGMIFSFVADRWVYLPALGLIALVSGVVSRLARSRIRKWPAAVAAALVLSLLAVLTWNKADIYRTREALWNAMIAGNPECWVAWHNQGHDLFEQGRIDEAIADYEEAIRIRPGYAKAHSSLGSALQEKGRIHEAIAHLKRTLEIQPEFAGARFNLGNCWLQSGNLDEAAAAYRQALETQPDLDAAHNNLAFVLSRQGKPEEAVVHYNKVIELKPERADARGNLGLALLAMGRLEEAVDQYEKALEINPREVSALNNLAWLLATSTDASRRNGARALKLAQDASGIAGETHPEILRTLAAAQAETGVFSDALETAQRAIDLASAQGNVGLADVIRNERDSYWRKSPWRDESLRPKRPVPASP